MENNSVPYIVFEGAEAKNERIIKRLIIALAITVALMFATNIFWIYEFCSFDYTTEETTVETDSGTANYIEFGMKIQGKDTNAVLAVMDELMSTISILNSSLYNGVMRKLSEI